MTVAGVCEAGNRAALQLGELQVSVAGGMLNSTAMMPVAPRAPVTLDSLPEEDP